MAVATGKDDVARRITAALGLDRCRALKLRMAVDDVVTVEAEQYVDARAMDTVATVLENREYVLVPKVEADEWIAAMEKFISMTDPWQGFLCIAPVVGPEANAARLAFRKFKKALKGRVP